MKTLGLLIVVGAMTYVYYPNLLSSFLLALKSPAPRGAEPKEQKEEKEVSSEPENSGDHLFGDDLKG
jgi:hypothetical protein